MMLLYVFESMIDYELTSQSIIPKEGVTPTLILIVQLHTLDLLPLLMSIHVMSSAIPNSISFSQAVKERISEAGVLTGKLQEILDLQASIALGDTLVNDQNDQPHSKSTSLRKTRSKLRRTMLDLASVNDSLADAYMSEMLKRERELADLQATKGREGRLKQHVRRIRQESTEAIRLKEVVREEVELEVSAVNLMLLIHY